MSIQILIDSQGFTGFTEAVVSRSIFNASGKFKFTASPQDSLITGADSDNYPLQVQRQCTILVDDEPFLTGFSDEVIVKRSVSQSYIEMSGRDRTMDLIDSTLDAQTVAEFSGNITLKEMADKIIAALGIKDVKVIDTVGTRKFTKGELINFQQGETAFTFLQKYANKVNVLLTTDGKGNLTITNGTTTAAEATISPAIIIDSQLMLSTGKQFNKYVCYAQSIVAADLVNIDNNRVAGNGSEGRITNTAIRAGRQLVFISDTPLPPNEATDRATWESNFRQAMGFRYQVVVKDFTHDGGKIWQPNTPVNVEDTFTGINSKLLVETVSFSQSSEGLKTTLSLVPPNAYQLKISQDYRQSLANQSAQPFAGVDP